MKTFASTPAQRSAANEMPSTSSRPPRIRISAPSVAARGLRRDFTTVPIHARDKITQLGRSKVDQSIGSTAVAAKAQGLNITADAVGVVSSKEFPDGFRWLQTVTTNDPSNTPVGAPLLATPTTYVDPLPNDDTKPFYWTDAEEATNVAHFYDGPERPTHPTGTIVWDAILSLGGVNGTTVTRFDSLKYGFSLDNKGAVTMRAASSPADLSTHTSTLAAEFPAWTFK